MRLSIIIMYKAEDEPFLDELYISLPKVDDYEYIFAMTKKIEGAEGYETKETEIDVKNNRSVVLSWGGKTFDFSQARNAIKELSEADYILYLDADERLIPHQYNIIKETMDYLDKNDNIWAAKSRNVSISRDYTVSNGYNVTAGEQVKLFKNKKEIMYIGKIHENVSHSINNNHKMVLDTPLLISHIGYDADIDTMIKKYERNITGLILQGKLTIENNSFYNVLKRDMLNLDKLLEIKKGIK